MPRPRSCPASCSADPARGTGATVRVTDLIKRHRGRAVVDGVSFSAAPSAVTCMLGPNGAGKTTTVECCEGLRRPDSGQVTVLGLDPIADAIRLRPRVGVMLQDLGLPPGARAGDLLRHVARLYARPLPPQQLLDLVGLTEQQRTTVRRLSGGQRQRLGMALALVGRPELVFLDEPSSGLDPHARMAVWEVIRGLRADGVTVVLTTHLMDEAERLADHVVVLDAGRVVAAGTPAQLTGAGDGALRFCARPGLDLAGLVAALPATVRVSEVSPGQYAVEAGQGGVDPRVIATVTAWCAEHGIMPSGLTLRRRTLEDVFLELTGKALR